MTASTTHGPQMLLQMSGVPGAGKSSIAGEIVRRRGFTALDHDVVKTALLDAATDDGPALFRRWAASMARPEHGLLILDTSGDFEGCVQRALAFLDADQEQS